MKRILLVAPGHPKRSVVLVSPPYPEVGDEVTRDEISYRVWNVEDTDGIVIPLVQTDTAREAIERGKLLHSESVGDTPEKA